MVSKEVERPDCINQAFLFFFESVHLILTYLLSFCSFDGIDNDFISRIQNAQRIITFGNSVCLEPQSFCATKPNQTKPKQIKSNRTDKTQTLRQQIQNYQECEEISEWRKSWSALHTTED